MQWLAEKYAAIGEHEINAHSSTLWTVSIAQESNAQETKAMSDF